MKHMLAAGFTLVAIVGLHANDPVLSGDYVEARTAEIFTGGCIMGSEGEVSGRGAIMAWRVNQGSMYGVPLDGLAVVAVVEGDSNLGTHELGGAPPSSVKAVVLTDERATPAQQQALVALARTMAPDVVRDVVATKTTPIRFTAGSTTVQVAADAAHIDVVTEVEHSPDCGAMKWYDPLARTENARVGLTRSQGWSGSGLGSNWKQTGRRSSYVGTFRLGR